MAFAELCTINCSCNQRASSDNMANSSSVILFKSTPGK